MQAVIPGGSSTPMLSKEQCDDMLMDFDALRAEGTGLGTAAVIVMNKDVDLLRVMTRISAFYKHESCGQCTPCREGTGWLWRIVSRIENGHGTEEDLDQLLTLADRIQGKTICALGDAAAMPVRAFVENFKDEFSYHITHKKCMVDDPQ